MSGHTGTDILEIKQELYKVSKNLHLQEMDTNWTF